LFIFWSQSAAEYKGANEMELLVYNLKLSWRKFLKANCSHL